MQKKTIYTWENLATDTRVTLAVLLVPGEGGNIYLVSLDGQTEGFRDYEHALETFRGLSNELCYHGQEYV